MNSYFVFFALLLSTTPLYRYNEKGYVVLSVIILIGFSAFRAPGVDVDYHNYLNSYFTAFNPSSYFFEPFSKLIFNLVYTLRLEFMWALFLVSLISVSMKLGVCKKNSLFIPAVVLIYATKFLLIQEMMQMRTALALSFILLGFDALADRNRLKYIALVFIAALFHASSLVFLFFGGFSERKLNKGFWLLSIISIYFLSVLGLDITYPFKVITYIPTFEKYSLYWSVEWQSRMTRINIFNVLNMINFIVVIFCIIFAEKITKLNKNMVLYIKALSISVIITPALLTMPVLAFRIGEMFGFFLVPLVASLWCLSVKSWYRTVYLFFIITLSILQLYIIVIHTESLSEYKMVFFQ